MILATMIGLLFMRRAQRGDEPGGARELYYALAPGQEIAIRLQSEEPRLRILAHLETPDPGVDDEALTWLYGLRIALEPTGEDAYVREHWTRSRRTILETGELALESVRRDTVITDSRIVEIDPAHLLPKGGTLRLRPLLEQGNQRLLLRVYRELEADPLHQTRLLGSPERRAARADGVYPFAWDNLTMEEQDRLTSWRRERLHAETQTAETVPVHRKGPPSSAPSFSSKGLILEPGQGTVVNLRGSSRLNVATELLNPPPGHTTKGIPLDTELVDASQRPVADPQLSAFRVDVPPEAIWSMRWINPWDGDPVKVGFTVSPAAGKSWGEPPGAGGEQPQGPEMRRLIHFRSDQGLTPIVVPVATGSQFGALAVDARPLPSAEFRADPGSQPEQEPVTITYTAFDEEGKRLGTDSFLAEFTYTPFERYVETDIPFVSEETRRHIFHNWRATTMEFSSNLPADLRFLVPLELEPERAPEYDLPEDWAGRYAPWEIAPYVSLGPLNTDELIAEQRLTRIDATVRIQPSRRAESEAKRSTMKLEPLGKPPRYPAMERFHRVDAPWQPWHRTLLEAETELEIPPSGELLADYRVAQTLVGREAVLTCGESEAKALVESSGGVMRLAGLPEGRQSCSFAAPAGSYLARIPGSGDRWVRRVTYRSDGRELILPVHVRAGERTYVYVRAYTSRASSPPTLETLLDDGQPRRHGGPSTMLSRATRQLQPERTGRQARLEDSAQGELASWEALRLVLGDDLVSGTHHVKVRVTPGERGPTPVFLRFESTFGSSELQLPEHWAKEVKCEFRR